jgi:hypothetical protein
LGAPATPLKMTAGAMVPPDSSTVRVVPPEAPLKVIELMSADGPSYRSPPSMDT